MYYSGIGSRKTPEYMQLIMTVVATILDDSMVLRSGGANGADIAFERGANNKEIYLPFEGFNKSDSSLVVPDFDNYEDIREIASYIHPKFKELPLKIQDFHVRNVCQVLGRDLETPSNVVICYTSDGANSESTVTINTGGTGTAIRLASRFDIPVLNLSKRNDFNHMLELVGEDYILQTLLSLSDVLDKKTLEQILMLFER